MAKKFTLRWRHGYGIVKTATVLVSDEDAHLLRNMIWHVCYDENGRVLYIKNKPSKNGAVVRFLSREIMGANDEQEIEYINGDHLDCRRSNLRLVKKGSQWFASLKKQDSTA